MLESMKQESLILNLKLSCAAVGSFASIIYELETGGLA